MEKEQSPLLKGKGRLEAQKSFPEKGETYQGICQFLIELAAHKADQGLIIKQTELAKQFGVSRERVGQILAAIKREHPELPTLTGRETAFEMRVKVLKEKGLNHHEIAQKLRVGISKVDDTVKRLLETEKLESPKERKKRLLSQIKELREARVTSIQEIAKRLGIKSNTVVGWVMQMIREGAIERAKKRMSKEEKGQLEKEVAELRQKGLTIRQITEALGLKSSEAHLVVNTLHKLIHTGVIERKDKEGAPANSQELYQQVKSLRREGFRNSEIAQKLCVKQAKVERIAHKLIKAGEIEPQRKRKP